MYKIKKINNKYVKSVFKLPNIIEIKLKATNVKLNQTKKFQHDLYV